MKARLMFCLAGAAFLGAGLFSTAAFSKPEYAKKEGKPCTHCHVKAGQPENNETGKCYKANNYSLEKCKDENK